MLTQEKKEFFRNLLEQKLDELMAQTSKPNGYLAGVGENSAEFMEQAAMESNVDFTLHLRERESNLIYKIDHALERLQRGDFGICESCGEEIPEKRLKARPVTTLCIDCKKEQEAQERLQGI